MQHPKWLIRSTVKYTNAEDVLGFLPMFLDLDDPRSAKEQLDANYAHGGGWQSFKGHKMLPNGDLQYPGDEPTQFVAHTHFRNERVVLYEHGWVAIVQPDGSFEVARMD